MTDRARRVYALLRTLLSWVPSPAGSADHSLPGFDARERRCESCRVKGASSSCSYCAGTGMVAVVDPMQSSTRRSRMGGTAADRERAAEDAVFARDRTIERIGAMLLQHAGSEAPADMTMRAVLARDRLYRRGSYVELWRLLERLRGESDRAYRVAVGVVYQPWAVAPVEPEDAGVRAVCEWLALRMPERIRVPRSVEVYRRDELEAQAAALRGRAEWRGRRQPLARAQRDGLIRELAGEGLSAGQVASRVGVSKRTAERVLAAARGKTA